jgi:hypothetical protein
MKQLIILVCTVPVGTQSEVKARERLVQIKGMVDHMFDEKLQEETNTIIRVVVLAGIPGQEAKMECIYPVNPSPDVLNKINELLDKNDKAFKL